MKVPFIKRNIVILLLYTYFHNMEQGEDNLPEFGKKLTDDFPVLEKKSPRSILNIRALVWNRKSHGLYDYESKEITRSNLV